MPTEKEIGGWVFPNNDHIIKMARSAGMHYSGACTLTGMESHLERFAALVAAHEREAIRDAISQIVVVPTLSHGLLIRLVDVDDAIRARGETK